MTFEDFWKLYPRHMARRKAENSWGRLTEEQKFAAVETLPTHVRYWEASGTSKEFLPYPATWLNQGRWEDELEMPRPADEWWRSGEGIVRKAGELSVKVRPGESYEDLKARVMAAMR